MYVHSFVSLFWPIMGFDLKLQMKNAIAAKCDHHPYRSRQRAFNTDIENVIDVTRLDFFLTELL